MQRTLRFSTIGAFLGIILLGCGSRRENPGGAPPGSQFRVALLTPGPVSDQSWNGGAYQGLLWIRDSLGAQISHVQTKTPAEFEDNFRQYGTQGYDLVFGHGFEFQDAARRVAPEFPRTLYVTTSGSTAGANLAGMIDHHRPGSATGANRRRLYRHQQPGQRGEPDGHHHVTGECRR